MDIKKNIKKAIVIIATLSALAGAIKWSGDYNADRNFKKLPKQQQVYVDSLMKSGNINQSRINKNISLLNSVTDYLEGLNKYVNEQDFFGKLNKNKNFSDPYTGAPIAITIRVGTYEARLRINRIRQIIEQIEIFDMREAEAKVTEIEKNITEIERLLPE